MSLIPLIGVTSINNTIGTLSGIPTRNACSDNSGSSPGIGTARDWIKNQFIAAGLSNVAFDSFPLSGCSSGVTLQNVMGSITGVGHPGRLIVIGGHYDSRTVDLYDGTSSAPGANDSGSQTALVIEVAKAMATKSYDATVVFVAFAAEEEWLVGSAHFASNYQNYFPGATIEAMFNADIVGGDNTVNDSNSLQQFRLFSPGTPREVSAGVIGTTDDTSPSRGVMRYIGYWGNVYMPTMTMLPQLREDRPYRGGDHESFLNQGIPGVRYIETNEQTAHQHDADDLMTYVTPDYTVRVSQVVMAVAASLASAPTAPRGFVALGASSGPLSLSWMTPISGSPVDHYVVAARSVNENFYHDRIYISSALTSATLPVSSLALPVGTTAFFISVAAVDAAGHESLFAYPEYRCDSASCTVPSQALNVTITE